MYSDQSVIAFAKWWYGTEADSVFKGQSNVSVEQGFEWWKNNRASDNAESAPSASSNTASKTLPTFDEYCEWSRKRKMFAVSEIYQYLTGKDKE